MELTWFMLWGLLWAIYLILDGFDFGLGVLLPVLGETELDKRTIYAAAGPFWDGNEVWLITAGGVTFAAFPKAYAVMFSALYAPLLLLLFALILRAVSFEFRHQSLHPVWQQFWDIVHFFANLAPALLLGVFFANLFMGIPLDANGVYHGSLLKLLNPYGLAGGVLFLCIFIMHGALWLAVRTEGNLHLRALTTYLVMYIPVGLLLLLFLILTVFYTNLYHNYLAYPGLVIFPLLAVLGFLGSFYMANRNKIFLSWACSAVFIFGVTAFGVAGMFPNLVLSSMDPAASVTIFNAASSPLTLQIMLGVALVFVPLVLIYQTWTYLTFSGVITSKSLEEEGY